MTYKKLNEQELGGFFSRQLSTLQKDLSAGNCTIEEIGELIPGSVMVEDLSHLKLVYMNRQGCDGLHHSQEELTTMGPEYFSQFFPPEEIGQHIRNTEAMLSRQDQSEVISFFQRVRPDAGSDFEWYFSSVKALKRQSDQEALRIIVISHKLSTLGHSAKKMHRLLEENEYMKKHFKKFASLTKREKEVITMLVNGRSSGEIADLLCLSSHTVKTHRKNIYEKLQCGSFAELLRFALAFDLVE